eukprot:scaffold363_cov331-Pavlova_lutheri.AAC.83
MLLEDLDAMHRYLVGSPTIFPHARGRDPSLQPPPIQDLHQSRTAAETRAMSHRKFERKPRRTMAERMRGKGRGRRAMDGRHRIWKRATRPTNEAGNEGMERDRRKEKKLA